jgi:hypothetical protein
MNFLERCYRKNPLTISKVIDTEVFLAPAQDNMVDLEDIYILDGVGTRIWQLIDGKRSVKQIKEIVAKEYEVGLQQIEDDLSKIFKQLEKKNCIKVKD